MALMDTLKQVFKGRSSTVEKGIDTAVETLGRLSDSLQRTAATAKDKVRSMDEERAGGADAPEPAPSSPSSIEAPSSPPPSSPTPSSAPPSGGSAPQGDLADAPPTAPLPDPTASTTGPGTAPVIGTAPVERTP